MGVGEQLAEDYELVCPNTGEPCSIKVGLRVDYEAGEFETSDARHKAATELGIALTLHRQEVVAAEPDCQPGESCQVPAIPFQMDGPRGVLNDLATSLGATSF